LAKKSGKVLLRKPGGQPEGQFKSTLTTMAAPGAKVKELPFLQIIENERFANIVKT
jgi:hypothetical protein